MWWLVAVAVVGIVGVAALGGDDVQLPSDRPGKYFTWSEFTRSSAAARIGDPNIPGPVEQERIRRLVAVVLDPLRDAIRRPVIITSGFRTSAVNAAIDGSSSTSQHMTGEAVDLVVHGMTGRELAELVDELRLPYDQLIWYTWKGHVHVSYTERRANRRQMLVSVAPGPGNTKPWRRGQTLHGVA